MDPMPMHESMAMPLLPQWLAVIWAVALLGVAAVHVWHVWTMTGQRRWWHIGHTAMALGMAAMYLLPTMSHPGFGRAGLAVFAAISLVVLTTTVACRTREGVTNPLWVVTTVDMLAMTYMFLPMSSWIPAITWLLVGYLVLQIVAWATNLWPRIPLYGVPAGEPAPVGAAPTVTADAPGAAGRNTLGTRVGLSAATDGSVRTTLAVMAAAMAYMLIAM